MTGVEILAAQEVAAGTTFNWLAFWITGGMLFAICAVVGFAEYMCCYDVGCIALGVMFGLLIGPLFGVLFGSVPGITTSYETQYKVIISDEVSMNEFLERYEIIDQEGKIYTVREINQVIMNSEFYKLYRKHQTEIFELMYDVWRNAPIKPFWGFDTKEEEEQYNKDLNEYVELQKPRIVDEFKKMGFKTEGMFNELKKN